MQMKCLCLQSRDVIVKWAFPTAKSKTIHSFYIIMSTYHNVLLYSRNVNHSKMTMVLWLHMRVLSLLGVLPQCICEIWFHFLFWNHMWGKLIFLLFPQLATTNIMHFNLCCLAEGQLFYVSVVLCFADLWGRTVSREKTHKLCSKNISTSTKFTCTSRLFNTATKL